MHTVFQVLCAHRFFIKMIKCMFDKREVAYLGRIVYGVGASMDPMNIKVVLAWTTLTMVCVLCRFLDLTSYYDNFMRDYGVMERPLTQLLKNEAFVWSPEADFFFTLLKQGITSGKARSSQTLTTVSLSIAMARAKDLAPSCNKTMGSSPSIAGMWCHGMPSLWHMTTSSSGLLR